MSTTTSDRPAVALIGDAWRKHAGALAAWADKHLVNRRDAYGGYYRKNDATLTTTRKATDRDGPLTLQTLVRHFRARGTSAVVGLHSTFRDEAGECWSLWLGVDIDLHGDDGDPEANLRAALAWYDQAVALGFRPLLFTSNGKGGYHLWIVFDAPVRTQTVFAFAQWLVRDWETHGLAKPPETFPKQPGIPEGGFGNWLRPPGRHHTRDHWSQVWDGTQWLDGDAAVKFIVSTAGDREELIPAEARPDPNAPFDLGRDIERKRAQSNGEEEHRPKRPDAGDGTVSPGADFNARASWKSILEPHGWALDHESEGTGFWRRPGKTAGQSATTNHNGNDTLYVFTDATVFKQHGSYSRFGAYTVLEHGGDFKAAARALYKAGYGTRRNGRVHAGAPPGGPPPAATEAPPRPLTDMGNAERLVALHGDDLRHIHPWKKWHAWDGQRWALDATAAVVRHAKRAVRRIYFEAAHAEDNDERKAIASWAKTSESRERVESMIKLAASELGIPALPDQFDNDPWLLNCLNGTVDLRTGELRPHRRGDMITKLCPVAYDKTARSPLWDGTLDLVFARNERLIRFWDRLCGYALTGLTREQILPILHGLGSNGKSTILNTMLALLGTDYAMKATQKLMMTRKTEAHPTELADLHGKRLVITIETEEGAQLNETLIKELTGSDPIRARRMREDYWQFFPTHKLFLATNHAPTIRGTDHAIWRRPKLIPFTVKIPDAEADRTMPERLLDELPGILARCVTGCLEWQASGLNPPDEVTEATARYRKEEDILGAFFEECCLQDASVRVRASQLYTAYRAWADRSGESSQNQRGFGKAMTERGFQRLPNNGTWYLGIGLRSEAGDE